MTQHQSIMRTTHSDRHGCNNKAIIPIWPPPRITQGQTSNKGSKRFRKIKFIKKKEINLIWITMVAWFYSRDLWKTRIFHSKISRKPESRRFPKGNIEGIINDKDDKFIFINPLVQRKTSEIINNNKQTNVFAALFSASL